MSRTKVLFEIFLVKPKSEILINPANDIIRDTATTISYGRPETNQNQVCSKNTVSLIHKLNAGWKDRTNHQNDKANNSRNRRWYWRWEGNHQFSGGINISVMCWLTGSLVDNPSLLYLFAHFDSVDILCIFNIDNVVKGRLRGFGR